MGLITRVFEFDAAHRVMNERFKCYNLHGHRFKVALSFRYRNVPDNTLGYALDFKEIKRVCGGYLDEKFDHAVILNPMDKDLLCFVQNQGWRVYVMGLGNGDRDLNPSAENLAVEIFTAVSMMFSLETDDVELAHVRLYETPSCYVEVFPTDIGYYVLPTETWRRDFFEWRKNLGKVNYDVREEL